LSHSSESAIDLSPSAIDLCAGEVRSSDASIDRKKLSFALVVLGFCFLALVCRAFYLQIWNSDYYRAIAENNRLRSQIIPAVRGVIYDNGGTQLVSNSPSFVLVVSPSSLPKEKSERTEMLERVFSITGVTPAVIDLAVASRPDAYDDEIPIEQFLEYEDAMAVMVAGETLPGISVRLSTIREYMDTPLFSLSHVLGYTGFISQTEYDLNKEKKYKRTDKIGKSGLESSYESELRGINGIRSSEVNAQGDEAMLIKETEAVPGLNLHLSVDYELTSYIENTLDKYMRKNGLKKASVIALNPKNGGVRALVSLPGYDNNLFARGISSDEYEKILADPNNKLFNRAVLGEFPSGSTIKPTIAAIALESGVINESTSFLSTGGVGVSQWFFPDWKAGGHGVTNVRKAIAESVNTFFYIISGGLGDFTGIGIEKMTSWEQKFGFGGTTGIDLPQEAAGFLPTKEWKEEVKGERWYIGDTYHAAIGQGDVLVTPLQVAVATSVFANGGTLFEPNIVSFMENGAEYIPIETAVVSEQVVSEENIEIVRQGMRQAVTGGSAQSLYDLRKPVAGKTGTAQSGGGRENHSWFTSFGPYDDPNIVVTVLIEEGGEGSALAAMVAKEIYEWWFANR
jgi:penicillin-binding protein 2